MADFYVDLRRLGPSFASQVPIPFKVTNVANEQEAARQVAQRLGIPFALVNRGDVLVDIDTAIREAAQSGKEVQDRLREQMNATVDLLGVERALAQADPERFFARFNTQDPPITTVPTGQQTVGRTTEEDGGGNPFAPNTSPAPSTPLPFLAQGIGAGPGGPEGGVQNPFLNLNPDGSIKTGIDNAISVDDTPFALFGNPSQDPELDPVTEPAGGNVVQAADLIKGLFENGATPEEVVDILESQGFATALEDPAIAGLIGTEALSLLSSVLTERITQEGGVAQTLAEQNPFGRTAEEDAALQALLARGGLTEADALEIQRLTAKAGITSPFAALAVGALDFAKLQTLQRIEASGGLDDPAVIAEIQRELARGPINNPFAFLDSGGNIDDAERILRASQQAQMQGNFLDFIGNPSAVGTAIGLFGRDNLPFLQQGQQIAPNTPTSNPNVSLPGAPSGGKPPFIFPDQTAGAAENGAFLKGPGSIARAPEDTGFGAGFDPAMTFASMFNDPGVRLDFLGQGNFRGAGANPNMNELRGHSDENLDFLIGQAAARGETESGFRRRVQSNTQQAL